jgi:hypothetical protein
LKDQPERRPNHRCHRIPSCAFRLAKKNCDFPEIRVVRLEGGNSGVTGREVARLKQGVGGAVIGWLVAARLRRIIAAGMAALILAGRKPGQ